MMAHNVPRTTGQPRNLVIIIALVQIRSLYCCAQFVCPLFTCSYANLFSLFFIVVCCGLYNLIDITYNYIHSIDIYIRTFISVIYISFVIVVFCKHK